jgi:hypothetical protein
MTPRQQALVDDTLAALRSELGQNLYSCCLYGSAVRGNSIEGVSDINLLIVLNKSDAAAHEAISRALAKRPAIDPFILGHQGFSRSARAFATKFGSIKRNYRVLHGADPLAELKSDAQLEKFLCEQALRNLRLRMVHAFVTRNTNDAYDRFIHRNITAIFVHFAEALRLTGVTVPQEFEARIAVFQKEFNCDPQMFRDFLKLKTSTERFTDEECIKWHDRLFPVIDGVVRWTEARWSQ